MLTAEDLSVIAMMWLTLSNLGYVVEDLDLSEPGYIQRTGPHIIYSFSIRLQDDEIFPDKEFCRLLDEYSAISKVKPHCYSIEYYPVQDSFCFETSTGTAKSVPKNNHTVYISLFL